MVYMTQQAIEVSNILLMHRMTPTSHCACGEVGLGQSYPDHIARVLDEAGLLVRITGGLENHELLVDTHDGFSLNVLGNEKGIDKLRKLVIPNVQVKRIAVYKTRPVEKLLSQNYTQLKELRGNG